MPFPPDPPPPTNPSTGRMDLPMKCAVCGAEHHPPAPPCFHTEAELEAYFSTQPAGPDQRTRWRPLTTATGELAIPNWQKAK